MKPKRMLAFAALCAVTLLSSQAAGEEKKTMTVFKTPWCGCCQVWTEAMEKAGYKVTVKHFDDLTSIRKQAGVSDEMAGCHTAILGEYVLEGHVPLEAIDKLVSERPAIRGISTPGMPEGSLGMGYDKNARYTVYSFMHDTKSRPQVFYEAGK